MRLFRSAKMASSQASGVERARTWMLHYRRTRFHLTRPVYNAEHGNLKLPPGFGREDVTARRVSEHEIEKFEKANAAL